MVDRYMTFARSTSSLPMTGYDVAGNRIECRATTRRGTRCQRTPLPQNGYCPSHQHLAEPGGDAARRLTPRHAHWLAWSAHAVGFIGLGIMGSRKAASLRREGFELTVFNRTRERAEEWAAEHGGHVAGSPREVGERSDVVITMVVDGAQVEEMLLGDDGAAAGAEPGTLFIDMSTIGRSTPAGSAAALAERGHGFVDAPVTGSAPKAEDGTLTIMAGGGDADLERAMPLLKAMGEIIVHVGEVGTGQQVKVLSNAVSAVNCATLAQALVVGGRAGGRPLGTARGDGRRLRELDDAPAQGRADARARLRAAVQARPHAQGRAAVPRGRAPPGPRSCSRGWPASSTRPARAADSATRTSQPCSRSSRISTTRVCESAPGPEICPICREILRFRDFVHSM